LTRGEGVGADIKIESWPAMTKEQVAAALVGRVAKALMSDTVETAS
jgi:hypothetical protein